MFEKSAEINGGLPENLCIIPNYWEVSTIIILHAFIAMKQYDLQAIYIERSGNPANLYDGALWDIFQPVLVLVH